MFAYRVYKYYCTCIYIDRTVENEVKAGNKQIKVRLFFRQHLKTETTKMYLTYVDISVTSVVEFCGRESTGASF